MTTEVVSLGEERTFSARRDNINFSLNQYSSEAPLPTFHETNKSKVFTRILITQTKGADTDLVLLPSDHRKRQTSCTFAPARWRLICGVTISIASAPTLEHKIQITIDIAATSRWHHSHCLFITDTFEASSADENDMYHSGFFSVVSYFTFHIKFGDYTRASLRKE